MKKIVSVIVYALLIFLALVPRSVEIFSHNYLFQFDQGREYQAAKSIVISHKFILIGTELGAGSAGISGIFHGPVYYYFLTIPFILFHGDPYGGGMLMLLFSLTAIGMGFILGRKLMGFWWGICAALLFAVSPPLISQARFIWSPNPPTVFVVLAFFFLYVFIQKKSHWALFWAAFFSGFVYNFEFALAIPMVVSLLIFSLFLKQKTLKIYMALFTGLIVVFLPMIFFEIRHHFLAIHGIFSYIFSHKTIKAHETFLDVISGHWTAFFNNAADTFPHAGYLPGIFIFFLFIILPSWNILREKNGSLKLFMTYLLLLIPVNVIIFGFLRNTVYHYYLTDLTVVYILLFTYCFYSSWQKKEKIFISGFFVYCSVLFLAAIMSAVFTWSHDMNDFGGTAKIKGIEQALDFIYKDAGSSHFNILVFAPPVYTYQYDYMIWWYGERKYHNLPSAEKKGKTYLLIEPDSSKPWSYQGWLETVIKTGSILQATKLSPSGFIIQKRQFDD